MKLLACFLALCLALTHIPSLAQSTFGAIRGIVADDKGAVVQGASVKLVNQDESVAREVLTDAQENYEAPNLKAGIYNIVVQEPGFKEFKQTDLVLDARQVLRVDTTLQIGLVGESVRLMKVHR